MICLTPSIKSSAIRDLPGLSDTDCSPSVRSGSFKPLVRCDNELTVSLLSERIFQTMCDIFTLCADFHWTGFSDLVFVIFVMLVQDFSTRGIVCMMCVNIHLIIYED